MDLFWQVRSIHSWKRFLIGHASFFVEGHGVRKLVVRKFLYLNEIKYLLVGHLDGDSQTIFDFLAGDGGDLV